MAIKKDVVKVGYIGLGARGHNMLVNCFAKMNDVKIVYICDLYDDRIERVLKFYRENGLEIPNATKDYRDIIKDGDVDAVINMTGWESHYEITKASLLAGKYTAVEVGCLYSIKECWDLIDAYETTGAPLMMLENCCYGRREMAALNIAKKGLFGEIVHASGAYCHYLPKVDLLKSFGEQRYKYRLFEYFNRNCEQYPTHALLPVSKVLGINRGNRFLTINSVASKSRGLKDYINRFRSQDEEIIDKEVKQGDIVNSVITCAGGETIALTLDTTLPRAYYSRGFSIRGTRGLCDEGRRVIFLDGMEEGIEDNEKTVMEEHDHPLYREYNQGEAVGSHGGMDWLVSRAFIESVKAGVGTPIDAYDTVLMMAIAALSEESILKGGAPVEFPDFTRGKWFRREPAIEQKYSLDVIFEDKDISIWGNYRKLASEKPKDEEKEKYN